MNNPRVDIICLVHNQLHVTQGFVTHLFKNTSNFNLLFIDNASNDGTPAFLKEGEAEGKWKVVVRNKRNNGIVAARNQAIPFVSEPFFMHIDNDQYVQPGWLEALFDGINSGFDIVGPEAWLMLPPSTPGQVVTPEFTVHARAYFPVKRCETLTDKYSYVGCGGMLIKKAVADEIGMFDEEYSPAYFEDPDFCWRAIKAGFKIAWQPNSKVIHLAHQTTGTQSLFSKNAQFIKSFFAFQKKWMPYYPGPFTTELGVLSWKKTTS